MITRDDMITRFSEREMAALTNRDDGRTIDEEVLSRAMEDAEAEAGSYLAAAGFTDFSQPPRVLVLKVCDIARYYLHEDGDIEIVEKRYQAAIQWLKAVVKDPRLLGLDAAEQAEQVADNRYAVKPNQAEGWHETVHQF